MSMMKRPVLWTFSGILIFFGLFLSFVPTSTTVSKASSTIKSALGQQTDSTLCKWEFSHYESSAYEEKWFSIVGDAQSRVCDVLAETEHSTASAAIVARVEQLVRLDKSITWTQSNDPVLQPSSAQAPADHFMSRMHYHRSCYDSTMQTWTKAASGVGVQLIEPLWGMLRDPYDWYCGEKTLKMPGWSTASAGQSKEYIMPQGYAPYAFSEDATSPDQLTMWHSHGLPPWLHGVAPLQDGSNLAVQTGRNIHLDLGSSYFGEWTQLSTAAASGKWFYDNYHARGITFDKFIAVEVEKLDAETAFNQIPDDLVGPYSLINVPLTMEPGSKLHAVDMIKRVVKPEDFFVFKLDIDAAPIEEPIIQVLLTDKLASDLVDELMVSLIIRVYTNT